jgi:hypothetical protein
MHHEKSPGRSQDKRPNGEIDPPAGSTGEGSSMFRDSKIELQRRDRTRMRASAFQS